VSATKGVKVDVRIVAATNRDLSQAVTEGRFREDLFYRLNVVELALPPLRERPEDLPLLLQYFRTRSTQSSQVHRLSPEVLRILLTHSWPGNVRELENVLERALVLCQGEEITLADLPPRLIGTKPHIANLHDAILRRASLADLEREYILLALEWSDGRKKDAADLLGIDRRTLYRKLEEYGGAVHEFPSDPPNQNGEIQVDGSL
jgi:DNA-binding NtrC family response regulator